MLFDRTIECNIHSIASTDHRGCSVLIKFAEIERGPGYWKFNNFLLKDLAYVHRINTLIDNHTAGLENKSDYQIEWELLKVKIRDFTRSYSKQKSIHNKNTLLKLYSELNDSDSTLAANPACVAAQSKRDQIKIKIKLFEQHKSRAAQVRARVTWVEERGQTIHSLRTEIWITQCLFYYAVFVLKWTLKLNTPSPMTVIVHHWIR